MTVGRMWTATIAPGRAADYEAFARDVSLPMFRSQAGFEGVKMMRRGNDCAVFTLWRDEAAIEGLEASSSYRTVVAAIREAGLLTGAQSVATYRVHLCG